MIEFDDSASPEGAQLIRFIPILILLFGINAFAQFDTGLAAYYRSSPLGASLDANVGYSVVLYGEGGNKANPIFGYMRTEIDGSVAPNYSGWGYQFQMFPISFLGVSAGQYFYDNQDDYSAYDCKSHFCIGSFREDFIEGRLALAYGPVFLIARMKSTLAIDSNASTKTSYISPDYSLAADHRRDKLHKTTGMLGYDLDDTFSVVATYIRTESDDTEQVSQFYLGGVLYKAESLKAGLLVGEFEHKHPGTVSAIDNRQDLTVMTSIQWNALPSVALF